VVVAPRWEVDGLHIARNKADVPEAALRKMGQYPVDCIAAKRLDLTEAV